MDTLASDVRYSVLKEKSSSGEVTTTAAESSKWTLDKMADQATKRLSKPFALPAAGVDRSSAKIGLVEFELANAHEADSLSASRKQSTQTPSSGQVKRYEDAPIRFDPATSFSFNVESSGNVTHNATMMTDFEIPLEAVPGGAPAAAGGALPLVGFSSAAPGQTPNAPKGAPSGKRTRLEKFLLVVVSLLFATVVLLYMFIVHEVNMDKTLLASDVQAYAAQCNTAKCLLVASSIYRSLNAKVDPCDDFYEYSCGGWTKKNLIPSGFPRWGTLSYITYENQLIVREQLESNATWPQITEAEQKAKLFYRSCMDTRGILERLGKKPLMDLLAPLVARDANNRLVINSSLSDLVSLVQVTYGLNALFEINVLDDDKNSTYSNIEIIQGTLGLDRSFYINATDKNAKAMEAYKKAIVTVITSLFGPIDNATQEMENIVELETRLAKIMLPQERLSNTENIYSRVSLRELSTQYAPFMDWTQFMNKFLKTYESSEVLGGADEIIMMGGEYFTGLGELVSEYQSSPEKEKTLKLTVLFHLIKFSLPLLSKEYRTMYSAVGEALTGTNTVERWQACIERTDNIFGLGYAISKMFIRVSPNRAKQSAQDIIKSIKKSFVDNFPSITWLDNETRKLAMEKVATVDDLIGYPDFIDDDVALNFRYKELNISEDDYFGNEIRLVQYALKSEVVTYRTRVNRTEWEMTSSAVNAYYSPTRNQIVFPSGILQDPFFHPDNPMSINYGSIGSIMGHELTHGFDDSGREYDKNGMMHQWWNNRTVADFKKASECIAEQYSTYKVGDEFLNGKQTLGENIADNGGLRSAFKAYENWTKMNAQEKPLPLLNLSHKQLFFISFAQTWCSKSTTDSLHLSLSVDQHSPPRYRVIGSVSNSYDFAKAFSCPVNSKMNPTKKCNLW